VLEAFLDLSLDETLTWLSTEVPEVTAVEVGAGGYAPHPHLDPDAVLADASARQGWLDKLDRHGIRLDALNVWGNPLHPEKSVADDHDAALRRAVRLAGELGTDTIVAMSGAAAGAAGDQAVGALGVRRKGEPRRQDLHRATPGHHGLQRRDL
jgi:sugar phosphate isomerase/epimerase